MRVQMWRIRANAVGRRHWVARMWFGVRRNEDMPADFLDMAWEMERLDYANARRLYYRQQRTTA